MMKKKADQAMEAKKNALAQQQLAIDQDRREEDRIELQETETSKKLALAMLKSASENRGGHFTKGC